VRRASILALLLAASPAWAGDRQLEVWLTNMTPDAQSSEASRNCVRIIEKKIRADYTQVNKSGETALRKLVGKTAGEPFLEWPGEAFKPARERKDRTWIDTFILIDCRPEAQALDVLVQPWGGGSIGISLRKVPLDDAAVGFVAESVMRRAWIDFSP
jgi:hypothetical protein